ncbi:MAG: methylenetetrahydrofolate reductase [NAD(P)H] [Verrucomicrobiota bacterium]
MKSDIAITELLKRRARPLFSVEFFPPKDNAGMENLRQTAHALQSIEPDFVSVTYGAGGSTRERTEEVCKTLRKNFGFTVMPHLTCVSSNKKELLEITRKIHRIGYRNIMALRGDPPKGETVFEPYRDGFCHASDLTALIHENFPDICLGVAGYPEKHVEAPDMKTDLQNLKTKISQGAGFITTQLFFDNRFYFDFVKKCRALGIEQPIFAGIMPVLSLQQIQRFTKMCGASLPAKLMKQLESAGEDAVENIGIEWASAQIQDLLKNGAPGCHLYILNRSRATLTLANAISELR